MGKKQPMLQPAVPIAKNTRTGQEVIHGFSMPLQMDRIEKKPLKSLLPGYACSAWARQAATCCFFLPKTGIFEKSRSDQVKRSREWLAGLCWTCRAVSANMAASHRVT